MTTGQQVLVNASKAVSIAVAIRVRVELRAAIARERILMHFSGKRYLGLYECDHEWNMNWTCMFCLVINSFVVPAWVKVRFLQAPHPEKTHLVRTDLSIDWSTCKLVAPTIPNDKTQDDSLTIQVTLGFMTLAPYNTTTIWYQIQYLSWWNLSCKWPVWMWPWGRHTWSNAHRPTAKPWMKKQWKLRSTAVSVSQERCLQLLCPREAFQIRPGICILFQHDTLQAVSTRSRHFSPQCEATCGDRVCSASAFERQQALVRVTFVNASCFAAATNCFATPNWAKLQGFLRGVWYCGTAIHVQHELLQSQRWGNECGTRFEAQESGWKMAPPNGDSSRPRCRSLIRCPPDLADLKTRAPNASRTGTGVRISQTRFAKIQWSEALSSSESSDFHREANPNVPDQCSQDQGGDSASCLAGDLWGSASLGLWRGGNLSMKFELCPSLHLNEVLARGWMDHSRSGMTGQCSPVQNVRPKLCWLHRSWGAVLQHLCLEQWSSSAEEQYNSRCDPCPPVWRLAPLQCSHRDLSATNPWEMIALAVTCTANPKWEAHGFQHLLGHPWWHGPHAEHL